MTACLELTWSSRRHSPWRPFLTRPTWNLRRAPSATKEKASEEPGTEQVSSRRAGRVEAAEAEEEVAEEEEEGGGGTAVVAEFFDAPVAFFLVRSVFFALS